MTAAAGLNGARVWLAESRWGLFVPLAAGALLPFGFAPFGWAWLPVLSTALLFVSWQGVTPRRAGWRGFAWGVGAFLAGTYWTYISVHVFGGAPAPLALFLMLGLVAIMAAYYALLGYVANRLFASDDWRRYAFALPGGWVVSEWLRGWVFSGFPWLSVGYTQTDTWLAGLAPSFGVFAVGLAVTAAGAALAGLVCVTDKRWAVVVPALLLAVLAIALGRVQFHQPNGDTLSVRLVQGAVPQDKKWLPEQLNPTIRLYTQLTDDGQPDDLVIWPEAAIPTARHNLEAFFDALASRGREHGAEFLIGAVEVDFENERRFNAVIALGGDNRTYYKRHLVPFGEYFPVPGFVRDWMRWMDLPYQDFSPGPDEQAPIAIAGQKIAVSICYEDVFGEELTDALPEATVLVNVTNDAWFGGSIAPHQHLQIARMRSIEAGRPMLRATNNGISAIIGPDGKVLSRSPQFVPTVVRYDVAPQTGQTPYSRWTNWPVVMLGLTMLAVARWPRRAGVSGGSS